MIDMSKIIANPALFFHFLKLCLEISSETMTHAHFGKKQLQRNMSSSTQKRKSDLKIMYCIICKKWLTGYYTYRHVRSQIHRARLSRYENAGNSRPKLDAPQTPPPPSPPEEGIKTPETAFNYRIEGDTLKKCPKDHLSTSHGRCQYFDSEEYKSNIVGHGELRDVKQKLFEKEQEQQRQYPDMPQPCDDNWMFDQSLLNESHTASADINDFNTAFLSEQTFFETIDQYPSVLIAIPTTESDNNGIPAQQICCGIYHNTLLGFLGCGICCATFSTYQDYKAEYPDLFPCGIFHHNQEGFLGCEICNKDKKTLEL